MHKTIAHGTITRQGATMRTTQGGDKVLSFSLAVSNGKDKNGNWRDKTFFDCSVWGKRADALERHLTGGTVLNVVGRVSAREHSGKAYLQLAVDDLSFGERGIQDGKGMSGANQAAYDAQAPGNDGDSIPF